MDCRRRSRSPPIRPGALLRVDSVADCEQGGERWQRLLCTLVGGPGSERRTRVLAIMSFDRSGRPGGLVGEAAAVAALAGRPARLFDSATERSASSWEQSGDSEALDAPSR